METFLGISALVLLGYVVACLLAGFGTPVSLTRFSADGAGCTAQAEVMNKVPFAVFVRHDAAFVHAERALRMAAKSHGLQEVLTGVS